MNKLYLLILCTTLACSVVAQTSKRKKPASFNKQNKENEAFLNKQWWLGFKAGPNLSKAVVENTYAAISPLNYDVADIDKKYESFDKTGSQATLEVTFYFKGFSIGLQPTYRHNRFVYKNSYEWFDTETTANRLELNYEQEQKIDYLDIPLVIRYEFHGNKIRPYLQGGYYSSILLNAVKSVKISGIDYASGGKNQFSNEPIIVGATDLFAKNHWGLVAGAGVLYNLGNVRLNLDFTYKIGMSNIASTKNRNGSDRLSGVGDTLDDMKLNTISVSVGCLFPLRFLGMGFKSIDK